MRTFLTRLSIVAATTAALVGSSADATVISQSSTFAFLVDTGPTGTTRDGIGVRGGGNFDPFDQTLGTLTSITLSMSGQGRVLVSTRPSDPDVTIALDGGFNSFGGFTLVFPVEALGTAGAGFTSVFVGASGSSSAAAVLSQFSSGSVFPLILIVPVFTSDGGATGVTFDFPTFTETLSYTYTPAIVAPPADGVPEPAPLALLGLGAAAFAAARRHRPSR